MLFSEQTYVIPSTGELVTGEALIELLLTVPGLGDKSVMAILAETGDIGRFRSGKAFAAFCGFDPSLKVSAGKVTSQQRRKGNRYVHDVIKSAAGMLVTRHAEAFGKWGYILCKKHRKGGFRKATGAVARRCLMAVYYVWNRGVPFSYEKYILDAYEGVAPVPVITSTLSQRVKLLLGREGFHDARQVAKCLDQVYGSYGCGVTARKEIEVWLLSCKAQCSDEPAKSSPTVEPS